MITFYTVRSGTPIPFAPDLSIVGYLPMFLDERDPDPAAKQIDKNYQHGGGWNAYGTWTFDQEDLSLKYPGDPVMTPIAHARLRDERLYFYPHAILCIVQTDGSYEVARVD